MLHNNVCKRNYDSGEAIGGSVVLKPLSIAIDTTFTCVLGHNKQNFQSNKTLLFNSHAGVLELGSMIRSRLDPCLT